MNIFNLHTHAPTHSHTPIHPHIHTLTHTHTITHELTHPQKGCVLVVEGGEAEGEHEPSEGVMDALMVAVQERVGSVVVVNVENGCA